MSTHLTVGLLNLDWQKRASRQAQAQRLAALNLDLLCVTEIHAPDVADFEAEGGFAWSRCSVPPGAYRHGRAVLGVAIFGGCRVVPLVTDQLSANDFLADNAPLDSSLTQLNSERQLAADIRVEPDCSIRAGAFAAPAARGFALDGSRIGARKPWFHARVAKWVDTWPAPYLFATDANTPKTDKLEWSRTKMHWPKGRAAATEEDLVGAPDQVVHKARDLWREWLASPAGAADLAQAQARAQVSEDEPLARSYNREKRKHKQARWSRYDQIWGTDDVRVAAMSYDYDITLSDHALVTATIELPGGAAAQPS